MNASGTRIGRRFFGKGFWVRFGVSICILHSGNVFPLSLGQDTSAFADVLKVCHSTQGNGFNWAASFGWLSESLMHRARALRAMESTRGGESKVDLACFAGSSSGSAVTAVMAALLQNDALVQPAEREGQIFVSAGDLEMLSHAVRFVALSSDFGPYETFEFTRRYVMPESPADGDWWESRYGERLILDAFARRVFLASQLTRADLQQSVRGVFRGAEIAVGVTELLSFPDAKSLPKPGTAEFREAEGIVKAQKRLARETARRKWNLYAQETGETALAFMRSLQVPAGFVTATFAVIENSESGNDFVYGTYPPPFAQVSRVYLTSEETAEKLLGSSTFQQEVRSGRFQADRDLIGVVGSLFDLMRLSSAEPTNQKVLRGLASALGLQRILQPGSQEFEWTDADPTLAVIGGWTHFTDSAAPLLHLIVSHEADRFVMSWFGKPGRTATFPSQVMQTYFYRNPDGSDPVDETEKNRNVQSYLDSYYARAEAEDSSIDDIFLSKGISSTRYMHERAGFNWDLYRRPAAAAGKGYALMLKGINTFRGQIFGEHSGHELGVTFDPLPEDSYSDF